MRNRGVRLSFIVLVYYILVYPIIFGSIFYKPIVGYLSFIVLFVCFACLLFTRNSSSTPRYAILWVPFVLYSVFGCIIKGDLQTAVNWFSCLALLFIGVNTRILQNFPYKFVWYVGLFVVLGILVQLFLPSFYNSIISPLIILAEGDEFGLGGTGYNGFTNQTGVSGNFLIFAEAILLYFSKVVIKKSCRRKYIFLVGLIIVILLTGKKVFSVLAIALPIFVYFFSNRVSAKNIILFTFVCIAGYIAVEFFFENSGLFENSLLFKRFSYTADVAKSGDSILLRRAYLYETALRAFRDQPLFGIGKNCFMSYTDSMTHVHNMYLQVLCEQGIIGISLFIIPLIATLIACIKLLKNVSNRALIPAISSCLFIQLLTIIYGITGNPTVDAYGYMMYFTFVAILEGCQQSNKLYESSLLSA